MPNEVQHEQSPLMLEDVEETMAVGGSGFDCVDGGARQHMRPIRIGLLIVGSVSLLIFAAWIWPQSNRPFENSSEVIGLSLTPQTKLSIVAESLLGGLQTSSSVSAKVMGHVDGRRAWSAALPGAQAFAGTVFYPFAGADVLSVVPLFPNARSIVLAALHKVGACQPSTWPDLPARVKMVSSMMQGIFIQWGGYFGTEEMFEHFDDTGYGVTPFLLASLSFLGEEPLSIECGPNVGPQGASLGLPAGNAVRIVHRNKGTGAVRELVYACLDLLTPSLALNSFLLTMRQQGPLTTMLKATAYIVRQYQDSMINRRPGTLLNADPIVKVIVEASQAILQDDTGVRASCLAGWSLTFWGNYVGPAFIQNMTMNISSDYDDSLHSQWCHSAQHRPLPVRFGYPMFYLMPGCPNQYNHACAGFSVGGPPGPIQTTKGFAIYAVKNPAP